MKSLKAVLSAFLVLALLCGCGNQLTEGEVYDKTFTPAHSELRFIPIVIYNGKTSTTILTPYTYQYPDTWKVCIRSFRDGEWETASYCVPQDVYNDVEIGAIFRYDKDRDLTEAPYTREEVDTGGRVTAEP